MSLVIGGFRVPNVVASATSTAASQVSVASWSFATTSNTESIMNPLEACAILQDLSEESSSQDDDAETVTQQFDKYKAQKLLYYAQGYFLALWEKKIFSEPIEAWDYGPAVRTLHDNWKDIKGPMLPKDVFKKARRNSQDTTLAALEAKALLMVVSEMFRNYSGKDLANKTHQERPWIEAYDRFRERSAVSLTPSKSDEQISTETLTSFFRKPQQLFSFVSAYCRIHKSEYQKIQHLVDRLRAIISHDYTTQETDELYYAFLNTENRQIIESMYTSCKDNLAWEQVNPLDCVLGYIFLPRQCEQLYEHFPVYIQFERIRRLLTLSARHGHPLAHAYLNRILDSLSLVEENQDSDDSHNHLHEAASQVVSTYLDPSLSDTTACPALYVGLLRQKFGMAAYSENFFGIGYRAGNALCAYHYALRKRQSEFLSDEKFLKLLHSYHEGLVPFLEAELATEQITKINKYRIAGEKGLPEGHFLAALLASTSLTQVDEYNPIDLYLKAGSKGVLVGYEKALEMMCKAQDIDRARMLCEKLETVGSTYGFALLGKILSGHDAEEAFRKAGIVQSYPMLRRFESDEQTYEATYKNTLQREYTKLKIDANYEELSPDEL